MKQQIRSLISHLLCFKEHLSLSHSSTENSETACDILGEITLFSIGSSVIVRFLLLEPPPMTHLYSILIYSFIT